MADPNSVTLRRYDAARLMRFLQLLAAILFSVSAAALVGCGSGGGSQQGSPGQILGNVDSRQASSSPTTSASLKTGMKVTIQGTNIQGTVAPDGSFSLPSVPPGNYTVTVVTSDNKVAGQASVQVGAGQTTDTVVTLGPAGQVVGFVRTTDSTGALIALSGVTVTLTAVSSGIEIPVYGPMPMARAGVRPQQASVPTPIDTTALVLTTTSGADGSYTFSGVPPGQYQVSATQNNLSDTTMVWVGSLSTASADLTLTAAVTNTLVQVEGTVQGIDPQTGNATPLKGATVSYILSFPPCGPVANPGGSGSGGSSGGSVGGGVVSNGTATPAVQSRAARSASTPKGRDVIVSPPPCVLPVSPVLGVATPGSAPTLAPVQAVTDDQGHYSLTVPASVTEMAAYATGYITATQQVTLSTTQTNEVSFTLQPAPDLSMLAAALTIDGQGAGPVTVQSGASLDLTLTLTNNGTTSQTITLYGPGDAVELYDASGNFVWSSTFGKLIPDIVTEKTLAPGDSITAHEHWPGTDVQGNPLFDGTYEFQGQIAGINAKPVTITVQGNVGPNPGGPPTPPPPTNGSANSGSAGVPRPPTS